MYSSSGTHPDLICHAGQEQDKRKARAARFDMPAPVSTTEQKAKLDKRQQRFGGTATTANGNGNAAADPKLEVRAKRFGSGSIDSAEMDAKKKVSLKLQSSAFSLLSACLEHPYGLLHHASPVKTSPSGIREVVSCFTSSSGQPEVCLNLFPLQRG